MKVTAFIAVICFGYYLYRPQPDGLELPTWHLLTMVPLKQMLPHFVRIAGKIKGKPEIEILRSFYGAAETDSCLNGLSIANLTDFEYEEKYSLSSLVVNRDATSNKPTIIYYHGGGFVVGSPRVYLQVSCELAEKTGAAVVLVDYRKAPTHPYPRGLDDCAETTKWIITNHQKLGFEGQKFMLMGDSAGGHLTATVFYKLPKELQQKVIGQFHIYPVTQGINYQLPSYDAFKYDPAGCLDKSDMTNFMSWFLHGENGWKSVSSVFYSNQHISEKTKAIWMKNVPSGIVVEGNEIKTDIECSDIVDNEIAHFFEDFADDYFVNPIVAPKEVLERNAKTFVYTCKFDVLRDEQFIYVEKLKNAGVDVTHRYIESCFHGSFNAFDRLAMGKELMDFVLRDVNALLTK